MKWVRWIIALLGIGFLSWRFGNQVPFDLQKTIAQSTAAISSVLFGVLGIWAGVMAPENLKAVYSAKTHEDRKSNWDSLGFLFRPIFLALMVFALSTFFSITGEILKSIPALTQHARIFRSIGFGVVLLILLLALHLIRLSIQPGVDMLLKSFKFLDTTRQKDALWKNRKPSK